MTHPPFRWYSRLWQGPLRVGLFSLLFLTGLPLPASAANTPAAGAPAAGAPVAIAEARQQPIFQQVKITGSVTSPRMASLSLATSGQVAAMYAEEGDIVQAGSLLLQLDPELAEYSLQAARAQVSQAEQALLDAQRRLREANKLAPQRSIAESAVRDLEAEVAMDKAALDQTRAEAARQQGVLGRHRLEAPFTGVISRKLTELGEWVTPGQGVYELVATEGLRLDFAVSEDYLAQLTLDSAVQFGLNALPDKRYEGRVTAIVPVTDPGARTFLLRVKASDVNRDLMTGMSAFATLSIATSKQGMVVPRDATLRYPDGRTVVWTVIANDGRQIAREKLVQIGQAFDGLVEIRSGLAPGDRVVVQGNESLLNGQQVRIVNDQTVTGG